MHSLIAYVIAVSIGVVIGIKVTPKEPTISSSRTEVKRQLNACLQLKSSLVGTCLFKTIDEIR